MSRLPPSFLHKLVAVGLSVALCHCEGAAPKSTADASSTDTQPAEVNQAPADGSGVPDVPGPVPKGDPQFIAAFAPVIQENKDISIADFMAKWMPKDAAKPITPAFKPMDSKYMPLIDATFQLTAAEKAKLNSNGFVVADRLQRDTMAQALHEVFKKDLPVAVTTDQILQALHASYDDILKTLEQFALLDTMDEALGKAHAALAAVDPGKDAVAVLAKADVDVYLAVARSLITGQAQKALTAPALDKQVATLLG